MNKIAIILLWFFCFIMTACVSHQKHSMLKEKLIDLEIENFKLKNLEKDYKLISDHLNDCLDNSRNLKFRLIFCDKKLGACFDSKSNKR